MPSHDQTFECGCGGQGLCPQCTRGKGEGKGVVEHRIEEKLTQLQREYEDRLVKNGGLLDKSCGTISNSVARLESALREIAEQPNALPTGSSDDYDRGFRDAATWSKAIARAALLTNQGET